MEINSVQGGGPQYIQNAQQSATPQIKQAQAAGAENPVTVAREAEISSSAALQAYQQQSITQSVRPDTVNVKSSNTLKNLDTVKAIEQMHSRLNDLVKGVRETTEHLNIAAEQVAKMQGSLMSIVKNYPPYPIESSERRELLMSYMSLRKEIESLMVPPPPQPVYEKVKSIWDAMFSKNGQIMPTAVPALEPGSSDKQVQIASDSLSKTVESLSTMSDSVTQELLGA